ncbi:GAF domain-containing protein [Streptomyces sp. NPDC091215]|uniref:GAF domain-containing protein n=1 Tax=Streptomyces sp. NPDC091215 TaxID=3155192 RepID=UPI00344516DE
MYSRFVAAHNHYNLDRRAELEVLPELAIAVNQRRDLPGLLRQIARTACELLGYESAAVLLVDDDRTVLRIEGSWGLGESYLRLVNEESPLLLAPSDAVVGSPSRRAFVEGEPVIVEDISHDPSYGPWAEAAEEHGHRSMASVPLRDQGETVGTMNVYGSDPRRLGPGGLELLQILASHAGIALETGAQLERDRRRVRELSALNELLRQHAAIHDRFIGVARRGGGVTDIATELAEITDRAVAVQDVSGQTPAAVPRAGVSGRPTGSHSPGSRAATRCSIASRTPPRCWPPSPSPACWRLRSGSVRRRWACSGWQGRTTTISTCAPSSRPPWSSAWRCCAAGPSPTPSGSSGATSSRNWRAAPSPTPKR